MTPSKSTLLLASLLLCVSTVIHAQEKSKSEKHGTLVNEKINSVVLKDNVLGVDPVRAVKIYLPPDYATSGKSYPVVFYFHSIFGSAEGVFEGGRITNLIDRGFNDKVVGQFIFVVADYHTAIAGTFYENSDVSGRWLDFTCQELVPFIDNHFRTLKHRDSRALVGDFMGGRGALKLAMTHAELFSVVYALHPVATGMGIMPWSYLDIDWNKVQQAKSFNELDNGGRTKLFIAISQAFAPNKNHPPFYCDYFMNYDKGQTTINVETTRKMKEGFLLEESLYESVANLKTMRGIAFDWGRYDQNQDHVYSNREFSRKLDDLGVEFEAEEYRGDPWKTNWTEYGRFYSRVLPFLNRHLVY